jgi:hypothetical protein
MDDCESAAEKCPKKEIKATPHDSTRAICEAILRLEQGVKTQEYFVYFKFSQRSDGAKLPQSAADDIVRCCLKHKRLAQTGSFSLSGRCESLHSFDILRELYFAI